MGTNRELISSIRSRHKFLSDALISDRAILHELKRSSRKLIKQQTDKRKLWNTDTIFTNIPCLEMVEVSISECCDYYSQETIARSKYKLPRIGEGIFQYLIKSVTNITGSRKFSEITPERYINTLRLKHFKKDTYYWVKDGYLYITNAELKAVSISVYLEEDLSTELKYPKCQECKKVEKVKTDNCPINPYDEEFKAPGYLEEDILNMTSQKLLGTYAKTQSDKTSDNSDDQVNKV